MMPDAAATSDVDRRRALARARQKRWRARQHPYHHELVVPVLVCDDNVSLLIQLGYLSAHEHRDHKQIGIAIAALVKDARKNA